MLAVSLCLLLFVSAALQDDTCSPLDGQPICVCRTKKGNIDLTTLSRNNSKPFFEGVKDEKGFSYKVNLCSPFKCGDDENSVVCQEGDDTPTVSCGDAGTQSIVEEQEGYVLEFTDGTDNRLSHIYLVCNRSVTEPILIADGEPEMKTYEFHLHSKCACPGGCGYAEQSSNEHQGVSVGYFGTALLIILLVAVLCYFIVGAIVSGVHFGKRGTEIIPQKDFWLGMCGLIKDGVVFTFSPVCSRSNKAIGGYEKL